MDYAKLGFKSGLECHQQLETNKLFCSCPSTNPRHGDDIKLMRRLRAVAGESGKVDAAAKHEVAKDKTFNYIGSKEVCCLVEMDEEPPHLINQDALHITLEVAKLLNAKIVDEIQVMRKNVIDGSNVSGFQRTALVAQDGFIETSLGKVGIQSICLEEEAAQKVKGDIDSVTYRLDRLGIPLIEIATDPDIKTPEHAKEVAQKIGLILRSTGKVKRGIGTIRQDVNISIKGGARIEIKGFQDLKSIPTVIDYEIKRQHELIKKGKKIENEVRKAEPDNTTKFLRPMPGAARMYPETDVMPIKITSDMIESIEVSELIDEISKRIEKLGLGTEIANAIAKSHHAKLFEKSVKKYKNLKPAFIADTIFSKVQEAKRKNNVDPKSIKETNLDMLLSYLDNGKLTKSSVIDAIVNISKGSFDINKYKGVSDDDLQKEIEKIVKKNPNAPIGALMGQIMAKFQGKADGKKVMEILKELVK